MVDNLATGHRSNLAHLEGRYEWLAGRPGRLRRLPTGGRGGRLRLPPGGDPQRPPLGPRAARVARQRPDRHAATCSRPRGGPGVRRFMFAASSSAYGDTVELPKHEGMMPTPAQPLRRRQAGGRALRQRLRPDDGARRREPALLQHLRPAAGPVEPVQRRDLAVHPVHVARASGRRSTATARRPATSPTWPTPWPPTSPRCAAPSRWAGSVFNVGTGQRISLLDLVAALNRIFGTNLEPILQDPAPATSATRSPAWSGSRRSWVTSPSCRSRRACARTVEATVGQG